MNPEQTLPSAVPTEKRFELDADYPQTIPAAQTDAAAEQRPARRPSLVRNRLIIAGVAFLPILLIRRLSKH